MCKICENIHSRAQKRARDRILVAEAKTFAERVTRIASLLKRKQFSVYTDHYARSGHSGELLRGRYDVNGMDFSFNSYLPLNTARFDSGEYSSLKGENIFYYSKERKFLFFPSEYIKFIKKGEEGEKRMSIVSRDGTIFYNPSPEDLEIFRKVAKEEKI